MNTQRMCALSQLIVVVFAFLCTEVAFAQAQTANINNLLQNLTNAVGPMMQVVTAIAYVIGMTMIIASVMLMKHLGESRTMMSREHSLVRPLALMFVGSALLYLPSSVQVGMSTFWNSPAPYGYLSTSTQDSWSQVIQNCVLIMQLVGTIAFVRGLIMLSHIGGHQGHQGGTGRAISYIIAGIFCINIYQFYQVLQYTLGLS